MIELRLARTVPADVEPVEETGTLAEIRERAGRLARDLAPGTSTTLARPGLAGAELAAFVEGLLLGGYRFTLATLPERGAAPAPAVVELAGVTDAAAVARGSQAAAATAWARDLANTPSLTKNPAWLGAQASTRLRKLGAEVDVHDEKWLADNGFGGVLAVGGGSATPPRLIEARWRPRGAATTPHVVLVGKGITFDTGGINLKPGDSMKAMKTDMGGGAAVLAALGLVAERELPIRVTALVPAAENAFGGSSYRPSDVVRHVNGRTSEITNTDAEGRVVLADAMAYAVARLRPSVLVDIATLTGAIKVALGEKVAGLFATDDTLAADLAAAGESTGEPLWRMPLADDYESTLASSIADANNAPGNPGAITAALFLRHFAGDVPWAHLDIAGTGRSGKDDGIVAKGATGFGARLLAAFVEAQL